MTGREAALASLARVVAVSVERQRGGRWQPSPLPRTGDEPVSASVEPDWQPSTQRQHVSRTKRDIILNRQRCRCADCGALDLALQIDHIKPVAAGGTSDLSNLQGLCAACNMRKGERYPYTSPRTIP